MRHMCTKNAKCNTLKNREMQLNNNVAFWKTDLLIQASLGILVSSISHRDCILIMNLSSTTTMYIHSYGADSFSLLTLLLLLDISPSLSFFLFTNMFLSFRSFLFLCFLLGFSFSLSLTHSPILYLSFLRLFLRLEEEKVHLRIRTMQRQDDETGRHVY